MDPSVKIIDDILCFKHKQAVKMIVMDDQVPMNDRSLCDTCFQEKQEVSKYISITQFQVAIQEKLKKFKKEEEEYKKGFIDDLNQFKSQMSEVKTKILRNIDEILGIAQKWIENLKAIEKKPKTMNLNEGLQYLSKEVKIDKDYFKKCNLSYFKKIELVMQQLMTIKEYQTCLNIINALHLDKVQYISSVEQKEYACSMAFNNSGSLLVAGCDQDIKVWYFEEGRMIESKRLIGHNDIVYCLVFSKKYNWFASGSCDSTIRCWKEYADKDWVSTEPGKQHEKSVFCLLLNKEEDQLISCGYDNTIKAWKVDCLRYQLEYEYTFDQGHTNFVYCMSLNESETALVSCSNDRKIILWSKGQDSRWKFTHELEMDDFGARLCFISERQIIWQQFSKGITCVLELQQGKLTQKPNLKIRLNQENEDLSLFPTIMNAKKQIIIQKHNRHVYILKQQQNGQLQIAFQPIDCYTMDNYGALNEDGQYLIIWNANTQKFQVYNIV